MKVRIKGNPITPYGNLNHNQIISDTEKLSNGRTYPTSFLLHLVNDANAADLLEYETKVDPEPVKKSPQPLPSLEPGKASQKPMQKPRTKKHRS